MSKPKLPGGKRTALVLVFLAGHVLFALLGAAVATWALIEGRDAQVKADAYVLVTTAQLILFCFGGIAFLVWLHRAYANAVDVSPMKFTPGHVTASFFFPFLQLVRPYQAIQEMWRQHAQKNSMRILAWWLFFLAWEAIFFVALDELPENTLPSQGWWLASLIGAACGVLAAALASWMVFSLRRFQVKQRAAAIPAWAISGRFPISSATP